MTDKDPKDMTASELLRWAAIDERDGWQNITPQGKLLSALAGKDYVCTDTDRRRELLRALADKIDAELAQARGEALRQGAELWAKANGWPDFREGEDFGAWLDRCALKLPCDKDGEPWSIGDRVMPGNRSESTVTGYSFDGADWLLKYRWCGIDSYAGDFATSCKRPAPEVLLGDGKPVSKGEAVYVIESGIERTARDFGTKLCEGMDGWDGSPWVMFDKGSWMHARDLTHEHPVLGADGLPIKVGDTVWLVDEYSQYAGSNGSANGNEYSLLGVDPQETLFVEYDRLVVSGKNYIRLSTCNAWCPASFLTHTPPDTQERIDQDAAKDYDDYWDCEGRECDECPAEIDGKSPSQRYGVIECDKAMVCDLLRRQRELDARKGGAE